MSSLIRSFIAVPPNSQVHHNLAEFAIQNGLSSRDQGLKPVKTENIHLTLKFLGEIDQHHIKMVSDELGKIALNLSPFQGSVRGIGAFPGWGTRTRVIWVGVEPVTGIREIYQLVEEATTKMGIPSDGKQFSPHLTLARVSYLTHESENVINKLKSLSSEPYFGDFTIDRIVLFKSVLLPQGPIYSILSSHPLSG